MKLRMLSRISLLLVLTMLMSVSLPVLTYAASYIKLTYNSSSGRIHGIIYTSEYEEDSIKVKTYIDDEWTELDTEILGERLSYAPSRSYDYFYYYLLDGMLTPDLSLDKISISEDYFWNEKDVELTANVTSSVYESVYEFEKTTPDIGLGVYGGSLSTFDNHGTVTMKFTWLPVQKEGLEGYKVYRNGEYVGETRETHYKAHNLPYLTQQQFAVSSVYNGGIESPLSTYAPQMVPVKLQPEAVGLYGKPSGYELQPLDSIVKFTAASLNTGTVYTELRLTLNNVIKTNFDGRQEIVDYGVNPDEIDKSDFELVDENDQVIPVSELVHEGGGFMRLRFPQMLEDGLEYTLQMSSTSSGKEISLPEANTNKGYIFLDVFDTSNLPSRSYRMDNLVIGDGSPPAKPQGLNATARDRQIDISWRANTEADLQGYLVYLDGVLLTPSPITQTSYSISELTNGQTYHVNVAAVDNAGNKSLQAFTYPIPRASGGGGGGGVPPQDIEQPGVKVINANDLKPIDGKLPIQLEPDDNVVKLPANAAAITTDSVLSLNTDKLSIEIPGALIGQLQKLVSNDALKDAEISITFDKLTNDQITSALQKSTNPLTNTTLKAAGDVYEFSLSITTKDGKVQKLTNFSTPITLRLKIADGADTKLLGMYYLGDEGQLEYVGGQIIDGYMVADVSHFSKYAVLEYSKQFDDVLANHWASEAIATLVAKHVITGVSETSFAPSQQITRAEFASLLVRRLGLKAKGHNPFEDVKAGKWYTSSITAATEAGIINGRSATVFAPDDKVTRQEMAVMLMKAYEIMSGKPMEIDSNTASSFVDNDQIASWAAASIQAAYKLGFIQGRGDNVFAPSGTATRAEAAQLISNLQ